jgi:hypothetical protein
MILRAMCIAGRKGIIEKSPLIRHAVPIDKAQAELQRIHHMETRTSATHENQNFLKDVSNQHIISYILNAFDVIYIFF